jgi:hypothetical protein
MRITCTASTPNLTTVGGVSSSKQAVTRHLESRTRLRQLQQHKPRLPPPQPHRPAANIKSERSTGFHYLGDTAAPSVVLWNPEAVLFCIPDGHKNAIPTTHKTQLPSYKVRMSFCLETSILGMPCHTALSSVNLHEQTATTGMLQLPQGAVH